MDNLANKFDAADDAFWDATQNDAPGTTPTRGAGLLVASYFATIAVMVGALLFPDRLTTPALALFASLVATAYIGTPEI